MKTIRGIIIESKSGRQAILSKVVIDSSGGGGKELMWLCPEGRNLRTINRIDIDKGVGPTQIAVIHKKEGDLIFSANHGVGEVAFYEIKS